jgi:hypothetical protein
MIWLLAPPITCLTALDVEYFTFLVLMTLVAVGLLVISTSSLALLSETIEAPVEKRRWMGRELSDMTDVGDDDRGITAKDTRRRGGDRAAPTVDSLRFMDFFDEVLLPSEEEPDKAGGWAQVSTSRSKVAAMMLDHQRK